MDNLHRHHIQVETAEEAVTVTIGGGDGGIPGGFAKLFNRIIDSGAWARLSDAARAAYLPLVRLADHRNQFQVRAGQAALMKHSGLSRSSIKRAMRELLASRLVVLVHQGGVNAAGENQSNLYQLMVPVESPARCTGGSSADPLGCHTRTPAPVSHEPPEVPAPDRLPARQRTAAGGRLADIGGASAGPQLRNNHKESSKKPDAAALLEEKGIDPRTSRELAATYTDDRIVDVIETMEYRRARGKCENPAGFIRDALVRKWPVPKVVLTARAQAAARAKQEEADTRARESRREQSRTAAADESRAEQLIEALDDEELSILAESIIQKYEGNPAVLQILTRKPPRECRLMRMEIAAMMSAR